MALSNRQLMMFGAAVWLVMALVRVTSGRKHSHRETVLDDALDETFPASDPTATQDYAIPVNRLDPQTAGR